MKDKRKAKVIKKTLPLAKSLGELIKDEDGFVSKETILKVGLSTVAALGVAGALTNISTGGAYPDVASHTNSIALAPNTSGQSCANHTNVTTHTSY